MSAMPKKGFASITIPNDFYKEAHKFYMEHRQFLKEKMRIRSFSQYVQEALLQYREHLETKLERKLKPSVQTAR